MARIRSRKTRNGFVIETFVNRQWVQYKDKAGSVKYFTKAQVDHAMRTYKPETIRNNINGQGI